MMSANDSEAERSTPSKMVKAMLFCWRNRPLRPIAALIARVNKDCYAALVDARAQEERAAKQLGWWWLSFSDPKLPEGQRFVGVAIVQAYGVASAALRAEELGINPGGDVQSVELKGDGIPADEFRNRLLDVNELKRTGLA